MMRFAKNTAFLLAALAMFIAGNVAANLIKGYLGW